MRLRWRVRFVEELAHVKIVGQVMVKTVKVRSDIKYFYAWIVFLFYLVALVDA